jgi:holo-[acyl-carrier protein] synthase
MMKIIGTGVDIVSLKRVAEIHSRYPESFFKRILNKSERPDFESVRNKAAFLAKRFAAKEAVVKALGTGIGRGLCFADIVIEHEPLGRPVVRIINDIKGVDLEDIEIHISISDEQEFAIAHVIILDKDRRG